MKRNTLLRLTGALQNYAWGGYEYIPSLVGQPCPSAEPIAELWMGAHHRGPACVYINGQKVTLADALQENPEWLGKTSRQQFGDQLPFLFKVLDVREMLSIQSHPTKRQAEIGFAAENEAGVPLDASHRNFKDDNHKPEVMVALTDFWLLHGFRGKEDMRMQIERFPAWTALLQKLEQAGIQGLYQYIMQLPQEQVDKLLSPLHQQFTQQAPTDKDDPAFWAARALSGEPEQLDRGLFSVFLLNLVRLKPGEGIFQAAGVPHAYLEGVNVELMANSDNVFRGGLTPKHVDVPALLQHLSFEPVEPKVLRAEPSGPNERAYRTPAPDFQLSKVELQQGQVYQHTAAALEVLLLMQGTVNDHSGQAYKRGDIFLAAADVAYELKADSDALLFKATIPT